MSRSTKPFSEKYGANQKPEASIQTAISKSVKEDDLACAVAFDIAEQLKVSPDRVGRTADLLNVRLVKCQLGLFGYPPKTKIVEPAARVDEQLAAAVRGGLVNSRLPCRTAWEIAARLNLRKMAVSSACEAMGIKIKPCQLGAF